MNWNWKNQIYVIDDIIPLEQQKTTFLMVVFLGTTRQI